MVMVGAGVMVTVELAESFESSKETAATVTVFGDGCCTGAW